MSNKFELVRPSGNVFRELGLDHADAEQAKAILAADIIGVRDNENLSVQTAKKRTGIGYADFSRIRNADLDRFTIDRLMIILFRLGRKVDIKVSGRTLEPV